MPTKQTYYSASLSTLYTESGDTLGPGDRTTITGEPVGTDAAHIESGALVAVPAEPVSKTSTTKGGQANA